MRKSSLCPILWTLLAILLLTACQPITPGQAPGLTEAAESVVAPAPATPSTLLTLQPVSTAEERTAADIFTAISPAIAFVETPAGTGSAILIQGGYLLSNAHVVWPFSEVRVVFPDGSERLDLPVVGWDLIADLALVGPIETEIEPVSLVDAGEMAIGSSVYLIGYPGEVEEFPQPTITNGILSRLRTWDTIDYTFFQIDATIADGQSGGVMVTQAGDVAGISTFYYSGFGLAGSVADALPRLNAILGHDMGVTLGDRSFAHGDGKREFEDTLRDENNTRRYILQEAVSTEVEISVEGVGRPQFFVQTLFGYQFENTDLTDPEQKGVTLNFTVEEEGPYIVEVWQPSENENSFALTSSHPLLPYPDPDDGHILTVGETYIGALETPDDLDFFELELVAGDRIQITVDALSIDPLIELTYESDTLEVIVSDDDSGGGIFGESSQLIHEAQHDGTYLLTVSEYSFDGVGSYFVDVTTPTESAELTEPDISRSFLPTGYGKMGWYENEEYGFAILQPLEWESWSASDCAPAVACYGSDTLAYLIIEESLRELPRRDRTREGYISMLDTLLSLEPGTEKLSIETLTTVQGLVADRLEFSSQAGRAHMTLFAYVDETEEVAFVVFVVAVADLQSQVEPLIDLFFDSFRYWETDERDDSAAFHLDEGQRLAATQAYEEALEAYTRSIEIDPALMQAYRSRGSLLYHLGRYEEALADVRKATESAPDDTRLLALRSMINWSQDLLAQAIADLDQAIELDPTQSGFYNKRALILVDIGEYDRALADIDKTIELNDGELLPHIQDSRAYIYLSKGDLEKAQADYEAILDKDLRFPHALLGAGVVYGRLGDEEKAAMLIGEAMEVLNEAMTEETLEAADPQLLALLEMAEHFSKE